MGKRTPGVYPDGEGAWQVDKQWRGDRLRRRGFLSHEEAQDWLIRQLAWLQARHGLAPRPARTFDEAAARYVLASEGKASIETELALLRGVMPFVGHLHLHQVHDETLDAYVQARLDAGRSHKTINLALGVVRRILNLAATNWREDDGSTWLDRAPALTMLPLTGHQREPRPISWDEQGRLLEALPAHLARMALFVLNTGVRDDVACSLQWDWEIPVPQLGVSVFEVPRQHVKGRRRTRLVVCNSVAQSVVEQVRGQHDQYVFAYRRERTRHHDRAPRMAYRPITRMNNSGWRTARKRANLDDLHVHDLRHTVGMRLRDAGVPESTASDVLWHTSRSMTAHYSVAQIVELHRALDLIKDPAEGWNKSLATLRREAQEARARKG